MKQGYIITALALIIGICGNGQSALAQTTYDSKLICTLTKYQNSGYRIEMAKGWLPPQQNHEIIRLNGLPYANYTSHWDKPRGNVTFETPKRIEFTYKTSEKLKSGPLIQVNWLFTYFPHNNRFAARVRLPSTYLDIATVWGTCVENKIYSKARKNNDTSAQTLSPEINLDVHRSQIQMADWNIITANDDTFIYYHKKQNTILIMARSKYLDDNFEHHSINALNLKIGIKWRDYKLRPTPDYFEMWSPEHFSLSVVNELYAIMISDQRVSELLKEDGGYYYVMLRDGEHGPWEWRRTIPVS